VGLAQEIPVIRALQSLQATPEQLAALRNAVDAAHQRLAQQNQAAQASVAALRDPVNRARQQLLSGIATLDEAQLAAALRADEQVTNAQRTAARNAERLQEQLTDSLRKQLVALLTPAQAAAVVSQGRVLEAAERAVEEQQEDLRRLQIEQARRAQQLASGSVAGSTRRSSRGGSSDSAARMQRTIDSMRRMDASRYRRTADRTARQFGDPGSPGYQSAIAMFDQIRAMPDDQFRRQRAALIQRAAAMRNATDSPAGAAYTVGSESALDAWIQRYLLSPRAPAVLAELTATRSEGEPG
jgi:hypothetical protein